MENWNLVSNIYYLNSPNIHYKCIDTEYDLRLKVSRPNWF